MNSGTIASMYDCHLPFEIIQDKTSRILDLAAVVQEACMVHLLGHGRPSDPAGVEILIPMGEIFNRRI
jgi:hypothetical protein